jgi:hypothetical protein
MTKLVHAVLLALVGLVVLAATSRALIALADALQPLLVIVCVAVVLFRYVWWLTGPR